MEMSRWFFFSKKRIDSVSMSEFSGRQPSGTPVRKKTAKMEKQSTEDTDMTETNQTVEMHRGSESTEVKVDNCRTVISY